ncbi:MAG TPA: EAL domain-containing protein [Pyrinomonadaceae bacterium]|nr:EAL domain-containing protein [Pyrinomonadaceae bacterium]
MKLPRKQQLFTPYLVAILIAGAAILVQSIHRLPMSTIDLRFLLLLVLMVTVGARLVVHIPRIRGEITVNDTLIFLTMLICGGEAAVLMAALSAFGSSLGVTRKAKVHLFNSAVMTCSTYLTVVAVRAAFGPLEALASARLSVSVVGAMCLMGMVQYVTNSGLVSVYTACKIDQSVWQTWRQYYLWASVTYFAGASAAFILIRVIDAIGLYGVIATAPITAVLYFTYKVYLKNVETSIAQAEQARRHAEALEESEERFRIAFGHAPIGMALVAPTGNLMQVNQSLCDIVGYSEEELLGMNFQAISHPEGLAHVLTQLDKVMTGQITGWQSEHVFKHKTGRDVQIALNVSRASSASTESSHFIFQIQDITARKVAEERLLHDAFHDPLTGLPNRALFTDHLRLALSRLKRNEKYLFTVLFLDLDRFKVINDSLGHQIGDRFLIEIARRLEKCLRPGDTVARLGGDEFTILLEDLRDSDEALQIAERIQEEFRRPFEVDDHQVFSSASIGIAPSTTGYDKPEDVLRDADTAMYCAKSLGGTRHEVFDRDMHIHAVNLLQTQTDLRRAIERNEFVLYYQPIVSLDTFRITGFEALIRWRHPEKGLIPPDQFIPQAEEMGLIVPIGNWVLAEACRQVQEWQERFDDGPPLLASVNVSVKQLMQPSLTAEIQKVLQQTGLAPESLHLEITEGVFMEDDESVRKTLSQLRLIGVGLSIDDFGTGYSSLSRLHTFPISSLKIDRSFVSRWDVNNEKREIIRTIMSLAENLGLEVIAEGVETVEQVAQLRSLGCERAQGYFFSPPQNAEAAEVHLRNTRLVPFTHRECDAISTLEMVA